MTGQTDTARRPAGPSPFLTRIVILSLFALIALKAIQFVGLADARSQRMRVDFEAFHLVGQMIGRGELDRAYSFETMGAVQRAMGSAEAFMPWTYPPPFNLVVAPLGWLPIWLAYLLFTGATLAVFLVVLKRLAGDAFGATLLASTPAILVCVACGQNGLLTGSLVGLACLALLHHRAIAGLPLGLMIIKPHIAIGLGLYTLAARRWRAAILAAAVVLAACAASTLAFGPSVWTAFRDGVGEAGRFLEAGLYPMFRMVSVYAFLVTLGLPAKAAMAGQVVTAGLAIGSVALAFRRGAPTRHVLGLAVFAGLTATPYAYDYDLTVAACGVGLLMPDLIRLTRTGERGLLLALSWIAGGWGWLINTIEAALVAAGHPWSLAQPLSLGGPALLVLLLMSVRILARARRSVSTSWTSTPSTLSAKP